MKAKQQPYNFDESVSASKAVAVAAGRTEAWGEHVATSDLFAGDFGDGSERTLFDRLAIAKRGGPCRECDTPIVKGEITRVVKMADAEGFYGGRVCVRCLDADYDQTHDEEDNLRRLTGNDADGWQIDPDPLLRVWDTAADAMAEIPGEWWEEEPGCWLCEIEASP